VLEDRLLVWRLRRGSSEALCRIYEKYRDGLLRLAVSLSNDAALAEDVVHDVFVSFIHQSRQFRLTGSLQSYLATCVANRARNANRDGGRHLYAALGEASSMVSTSRRPDQWIIRSEDGVMRLWVDVETSLPVQIEVEMLGMEGGQMRQHKYVMESFEWNAELDESVFEPNIPDDFTQRETP